MKEEFLATIRNICEETVEALQQSFILTPKRPLASYFHSQDALKMIIKLSTFNNLSNVTSNHSNNPILTSDPHPDLPTASRALTEKALLIFLKHYYSLEWLEEFLFQAFFTTRTPTNTFKDFLERMRNLLLCIHLVHKTNPINPTAEFLALSDSLGQPQELSKRWAYETVANFRYQEYFLVKVKEASGTGYPTLANLWKRVALSQTPLNRSLNYYLAKAEEARIIGSALEINYWQQLLFEKRPLEFTAGFKSNSKSSSSDTRNIITFSEDQRNTNYFIQSCRAKACLYRTVEKKNSELASLWEQTVFALSNKDKNALEVFRIAWCLEKANDPNYRPVWPLWRILFHQIRTQSHMLDLSLSSETPLKILEDITKAIRNSNKLARHYQIMSNDEKLDPEISDLYRLASFYFTDYGEYLTVLPSAFIENVDERFKTPQKIKSMINKITEIYEHTGSS